MNLTVSDGGHLFQLHVKEDVDMPAAPLRKNKPAHQVFLDWWRAECRSRNIPYDWNIVEPMGIRVIQSMLKKYNIDELKGLASYLFLNYGERLRSDPRHFAIFASLAEKVKSELVGRV